MRQLNVLKILSVGQKPWTSGCGMTLTIWRLWVRTPAPYTGWTFFTLICSKIDVMFVWKRSKINEKEAGYGPFLTKFSCCRDWSEAEISYSVCNVGQLASSLANESCVRIPLLIDYQGNYFHSDLWILSRQESFKRCNKAAELFFNLKVVYSLRSFCPKKLVTSGIRTQGWLEGTPL